METFIDVWANGICLPKSVYDSVLFHYGASEPIRHNFTRNENSRSHQDRKVFVLTDIQERYSVSAEKHTN